jgi:tRNA uridine 5-carboxymethylaminomethyl modification enzyme
MAALDRLLRVSKVNPERLEAVGLALPAAGLAGLTYAQLLKRPEVTIEPVIAALREELVKVPLLEPFSRDREVRAVPPLAQEQVRAKDEEPGHLGIYVGGMTGDAIERSARRNEARAVETEIKFAGYLEQQKKSIEKLKSAEAVAIPEWIEYAAISGLSREMRETLERVRPITIGQASRIPGVTPAALSLVHVSIRVQGERRSSAAIPRTA